MADFEFTSVGRIIFGCGRFAQVGPLAAELGRTALVIANAGERGDGGVVDRLEAQLAEAGVGMSLFRQRGEPDVAGVEQALALARGEGCDVAIGLGGGSAMDAAKAVAGLMTNGGSAIDYMEVIGAGRKIARPAAPWIAVPTTAGTGAEVTRNAVIACREKRFKASIRSEHLMARVVLVDPELGRSVRAEVTVRAGMDALCQLVESYTSAGAGPITDALAMKGLALAGRSLLRACHFGDDLKAREDMAMAALLSGITLTNAGLGAVHGFAAPMGANFFVPHGTVCAALLPGVMSANVQAMGDLSREHPGLSRYAEIGRTLTNEPGLNDADAVVAAVDFVRGLAVELNVPSLGRFGIGPDDVPELIALARKSSSMRYNPVTLSDEALTGVLQAAL